jgi:two-component system chemotaxis sensor kinase CheA
MATKEDMKLFVSEVEDLVQKVESNVLKLEQNPNDNKPIQELYFGFHSLKGLTAMAGLNNVSKFCHLFETFLDKAKKNESILSKKEDFISFLFESLDMFKLIVDRVKKGDFTDIDNKFLNDIKESIEGLETSVDVSFINPIKDEEIDSLLKKDNNHLFKIYIVIQKTCVFKKVRLFIIFRALSDIGQVCWSQPDPAILEKGTFEDNLEIYFITQKSSSEINQVLDEILEIDNKAITELKPAEFKKDLSSLKLKAQKKAIERPGPAKKEKDSYDEQIIDDKSEITTKFVDESEDIDSKIESVKVNVEIIEKLMNYFSEIVIIRNKINQILIEKQDRTIGYLINSMEKPFLDIQDILFRLKLVKVESTFMKYKRLIRDLAKETGKKIRLILEGMNVEIDRMILEEINTPIVHLLRNAIYHGIEKPNERKNKKKDEIGTLKLKTFRSGGSIYIEVSDDGKGIDYNKIRDLVVQKGFYPKEEVVKLNDNDLNQFILMPGFSTLPDANVISGRGLGLAIVADKLKELGGLLNIYSEKDKGTKFSLIVPFTRAIFKAQLVKVANDLFAIPIENIEQIYFFNQGLVEIQNGNEFYKSNNQLIPIFRLDQILNIRIHENEDSGNNSHSKIAILCKNEMENYAIFVVDDISQQLDIVVKPFKSSYSDSRDILGSTILGDGTICLVIDVLRILSSRLDIIQFPEIKNVI